MNIAFSALVILTLALPGLCFLAAYRYDRGRPATTRPLADDLPIAIGVSALFHFVWVLVFAAFGWFLGATVSLSAVLTLLASPTGRDGLFFLEARNAVVTWPYPAFIALYFVSISALAGLVGYRLRQFIVEKRWDRRFYLFRWNGWFYLLKGQAPDAGEFLDEPDPDMVLIGAAVDGYLYRGILMDFVVAKDGSLDSIVLTAASRRVLGENEDPAAADRDDAHPDYYYINAESLVLKYSEVKSLAVSRIYVERTPDGGIDQEQATDESKPDTTP